MRRVPGISHPENPAVLTNEGPVRAHHLAESIHKTGSIPACQDNFNAVVNK